MTQSRLSKPVLILSGATALVISLFILIAPVAFYQSYGIALGDGPDLVNELSAPAGMLLLAAVGMLSGVVWRSLTRAGLLLAVVIYCGYALSRGVMMGLYGLPESGLIMAAMIEAVIGGLAGIALWRSLRLPLTRNEASGHRGKAGEPDAFVL